MDRDRGVRARPSANGRAINDAITLANEAVLERAAVDPKLNGMGTTLTAVVVAGGQRLLVGHVGDSRAYFMHDDVLSQLTDDHSLVGELVREGRLTREQAEAHPQRAIVTRALGVDAHVDVDVYTVDVTPGDRVVICSDGLTDMVREREHRTHPARRAGSTARGRAPRRRREYRAAASTTSRWSW